MVRKQVSPTADRQDADALSLEPLTNNHRQDDSNSLTPAKTDIEKHPEDANIKDENETEKVSPKWDLLVYYAQNSTMHGIPSIVGSELYRGRHFFWIAVVCIMGTFLGTVIYWQMKDYYDYPTVTSVNIAYVSEDDFPAITVCDMNMFHSLFVKKFLDDYTTYHLTKLTEITGFYHRYSHRFFKKIPEPPPTNTSSVEYIEKMMSTIKKTLEHPRMNVLYCSWGDNYWTPCAAHQARVTDLGMCNTIDVRMMAKKKKEGDELKGFEGSKLKPQPAVGNSMRGLTFYIDTASEDIPYRFYQYNGFKIILHNPDEEPLPKQSGFVVQGNTTVEVEISKQVKIGLPPPYKAFGSGTCVDTEAASFQNPLKRFQKYTKEVCEKECFVNSVVDTCGGCRHFLHPGNESICEIAHLAECFRQAEADYYGGKKEDVNETDSASNKCFCPMPCVDARYSASVSSTPFRSTQAYLDLQDKYSRRGRITPSLTYIHFYYADPVVTTIKQVPIYSTEGLLGNIGGQIGLFMGFSLITVAENLELIFLLATRGRRIDEHVKRQKSIRAIATNA